MSEPLFPSGFVFPSDRNGEYQDLEGDVIEVGEPMPGSLICIRVKVHTEKGDFDGYAEYPPTCTFTPQVGHHAVIRVYNSGGGSYPDDKITSWGIK